MAETKYRLRYLPLFYDDLEQKAKLWRWGASFTISRIKIFCCNENSIVRLMSAWASSAAARRPYRTKKCPDCQNNQGNCKERKMSRHYAHPLTELQTHSVLSLKKPLTSRLSQGFFSWTYEKCKLFLFEESSLDHRKNGSVKETAQRTDISFFCNLLPSRLYCRPRSFTGSCLTARGLYRR